MTPSRSTRIAAIGAVALVLLGLTGCASSAPAAGPPAQTAIRLPADYGGTGPGTLKSAVKLDTVDRRIVKVSSVAARVVYESRSGVDGSSQLVSGTVFAPVGDPPPGGWPVIAFGHGTTGVQEQCAPSMSVSLLGASEVVAMLVRLGYVVTLTDYQGLGLDGTYHPYLDSTTEGFNIIDSVRAARKVVKGASDRYVAVGLSQGGQGSWAANELSANYGQGLDLIGSVSVSPAADISGLADEAANGTLTLEQVSAYIWVLEALKRAHPDLNLDDYRRGIVEDKWDIFTSCATDKVNERLELSKQITPDDLRPATPQATDVLRNYLQQMSLPKSRAAAPMLVLFGDRDQVVNPEWTESAIRRACDMGDVVTAFVAVGRGHTDIDPGTALTWITQRFDNSAEPLNTCDVEGGPAVKIGQVPWYAE